LVKVGQRLRLSEYLLPMAVFVQLVLSGSIKT